MAVWAPTIRTPGISVPVVRHLLEALARIDADWLTAHAAPSLYRSGVRYRAEGPGLEDWRTVPEILSRMRGDCEDLAAWRVAELRLRGEPADFHVTRRRLPSTGGWLYHIAVQRGDGSTEDPSRRLGM